MAHFLVQLSDKQPSLFTEKVVKEHIEFVKKLHASGQLPMCGPLKNYERAVMIIKADSIEETKKILSQDPLIKANYFKTITIDEFVVASDENDWTLGDPSVASRLIKSK